MNVPKTVIFTPIVMLIFGIIAIALMPRRSEMAAQSVSLSMPAEPEVPPSDVIATYSANHVNLELHYRQSGACNNLMGQPGWLLATVTNHDDQENSHQSIACWRRYSNYEAAWDGGHYAREIVAVCPLIDGIRRYEGCMNVFRDAFDTPFPK